VTATATILLAVALAAATLAACADNPKPSSTNNGGPVVESRQITDDELATLEQDRPLACADLQSTGWDYGPVTPDERGRKPTDALNDAITHLSHDSAPVRATGWTELIENDDTRIFVLADDAGTFIAAIKVAGDAAEGVWRHTAAYICPAARA
jgi:hypothetical protein